MRPICRNCEYFDCEGKNAAELPIEYRGDCLNPKAPGFQSGPEEFCSHFYPDTTRFALTGDKTSASSPSDSALSQRLPE